MSDITVGKVEFSPTKLITPKLDTRAELTRLLVSAAARHAMLRERERCAKIADAVANDPHGSNPACAAAEQIAADIRSGE